ncbi:MAG: DUF4162 domain-containing protein, partial [Prevotella sp.]|nr:DUF4162 domain-containing protein [Prevotella sp.]
QLKGLSRADATRELKRWFEHFDISSWWNRKVSELSKGMAQKVQFIVTVLHRPKLLIFDEPFSGFDPINANLLRDEILRLAADGATVIFSTHNMASVEEICDTITLINKGHNILTGDVETLRREFADGRYTLTFTGDERSLLDILSPAVSQTDVRLSESGDKILELRLAAGASLRDVIGLANPIVEIRSVNEKKASMNDIFIEAVSRSNS